MQDKQKEENILALGTYIEISTTVEHDEEATAFYEKLGFQHAGYRVLTDGTININLAPPGVPAPLLRYAGCDMSQVAGLDIGLREDERGLAGFTTPEGIHVMLSPYESRVPVPEGPPRSRCGKFGEYAVPVADRQQAIAYWEQLGFKPLHMADEPYPFAILSDELLVLGLHQTPDFHEPHITYFAPDMPERIQALQADGIDIMPVPPQPDERIINGVMRGPGGQPFFLFQGEI
jgi:hypothetical protein